jgi:hypothetical protein
VTGTNPATTIKKPSLFHPQSLKTLPTQTPKPCTLNLRLETQNFVQAQKDKEFRAEDIKKEAKQVVPSAQPEASLLTETLQIQGRVALPSRDKFFLSRGVVDRYKPSNHNQETVSFPSSSV